MFAAAPLPQLRAAGPVLLARQRDASANAPSVRVRRRRSVHVAVLSPDKEAASSEPNKLFSFFKRRHAGDENGSAHANGRGSSPTLDVRRSNKDGDDEDDQPFFASWTERGPTEEEAQVLREKLSSQAGGWDNWGAQEPEPFQTGSESSGGGALPSNAFLGIDRPQRELGPADYWDSFWRTYSPTGEPPVWTRPDWFPQFFDPLDRTSDMRRWIIPYVMVPYLVSQSVRIAFLEPIFEEQLEMRNPIFALKGEQEEKVEREVSAFRNHLQFEVLLGRSPPLNDTELQATLRKKALDLEREERERNCVSLANFVTDSTFAIILSANLLLQLDEAEKLRKTLSKQFFSLDSSRQAFILLLVSDILVGYHSAEGWSTGLEGIGHHYGLDERKDLIAIFVAVVPVAMDVLFKFWVFKYLRNFSPDTQVILEEIDRH